MSTYAFIISDTKIDTLACNLPSYIGVHDTHPLSSARCLVLICGGVNIEPGIDAVLAIYPDARATTSREQAAEWLKHRITPHKGGRTIKRSTDVTPETQRLLEQLRESGISLGDLVEEAARQKYKELHTVEIWKHGIAGEVFAVKTKQDRVVAAAGPLHHSEIENARTGNFDSDNELVDDLNRDADEYVSI